MAVWLVRAGRRGEQEQAALDNNLVAIGWNELPDLSDIQSREALADSYRQANPDASPKKAANHVGQVWAFRARMKEGDLAVLPLHIQSAIAIGRITGPYPQAALRRECRTGVGQRESRGVGVLRWDQLASLRGLGRSAEGRGSHPGHPATDEPKNGDLQVDSLQSRRL